MTTCQRWVDMDTKTVEYVKPRPQMAPLFAILRTEKVLSGDPDRYWVDRAALYAPVVELVGGGLLFRPSELVA